MVDLLLLQLLSVQEMCVRSLVSHEGLNLRQVQVEGIEIEESIENVFAIFLIVSAAKWIFCPRTHIKITGIDNVFCISYIYKAILKTIFNLCTCVKDYIISENICFHIIDYILYIIYHRYHI